MTTIKFWPLHLVFLRKSWVAWVSVEVGRVEDCFIGKSLETCTGDRHIIESGVCLQR